MSVALCGRLRAAPVLDRMLLGLRTNEQASFERLPKRSHATQFPLARVYSSSERLPVRSQPKEYDEVNPPSTTLPQPIDFPEQGDSLTVVYWFRIGRTFGKFYWNGLKLTWANHKRVRPLKERLTSGPASQLSRRYGILPAAMVDKCMVEVLERDGLTRAEYQMLMRDAHDWGKIPLFGLLACIFGEWLPLFIGFIPNVVPVTCRIPSQVDRMRQVAEERRRESFSVHTEGAEDLAGRQRVIETVKGAEKEATSLSTRDSRGTQALLACGQLPGTMIDQLSTRDLLHLSSVFGLHKRVWDRLGMSPPRLLLQRGVQGHLANLGVDDMLLLRYRATSELTEDEVRMACEQRGIDTIGRKLESIKQDLAKWLRYRKDDAGTGKVFMETLFQR